MKKYLLKEHGNFYKANLHMHTNISDGHMSIEETKKAYQEKGYSIVAFTDHELMMPHNDLSDENFLAITSTEISVNERYDCDFRYIKCYHLNIYSKDKNKTIFNTFHEKYIWLNHSFNYISDEQRKVKFDREYSIEGINKIIKMANDEECLVSFNHPFWSMQNYEDYSELKGLWGVEWHNNACVLNGYFDSIQPIDDLVRKGENVYPLATDDAHSIHDCFGGFVMVKADNLEYETIYNALKNGDFYSSNKPEIFELYIENGIIHIKTSNVKGIYLTTECRYTKEVKSNTSHINEAIIDINDYLNRDDNMMDVKYIRLTIIDDEGNKAYTRAYYINELR